MPKITVIVTVRNEEATILKLLQCLIAQTLLPTHIIITDAESSDRTVEKVLEFSQKNFVIPIKVF